jgi:hypothetical protein
MKKKKESLRSLAWADVIVYMVTLCSKQDFSSKDLVDYFHFKFVTELGIERWTMPNYIRQKQCAQRLMNLYGKDFSIKMIDCLFDHYEEFFHKSFNEIAWSLGILSSDKMGWLHVKLFDRIKQENSILASDRINDLLSRRDSWTTEERTEFQVLINKKTEEANG